MLPRQLARAPRAAPATAVECVSACATLAPIAGTDYLVAVRMRGQRSSWHDTRCSRSLRTRSGTSCSDWSVAERTAGCRFVVVTEKVVTLYVARRAARARAHRGRPARQSSHQVSRAADLSIRSLNRELCRADRYRIKTFARAEAGYVTRFAVKQNSWNDIPSRRWAAACTSSSGSRRKSWTSSIDISSAQ